MQDREVVDFNRSPRLTWVTNGDNLLNVIVLVFAVCAALISLSGSADAGITFLVLVGPIVATVVFSGQERLRQKTTKLERRLADAIRSSSEYLDSDVGDFQSELYGRVKPFEEDISYYETKAVVSLFAYARAKSLYARSSSALEHDQKKRQQFRQSLRALSMALSTGDYYNAFRAVADIILVIIPLLVEEQKHRAQTPTPNLPESLRKIAEYVYGVKRGDARHLAELNLKELTKIVDISEEIRWAALILSWIDSRLYEITLPNANVAERGILFCSEYELIALDIGQATNAFEAQDWRRVQEVISGSYRGNRVVPRFAVRGGIESLSSGNHNSKT